MAERRRSRVVPSRSMTTSVLGRKTEDVEMIYKMGRKLGQGQYGTTYLCVSRETGKEFACKTIPKRKLITQEDVEDVKREVAIMHHLAGHPNIVKIEGAFEDSRAVHIVMELCTGGELFDRIIAKGHYSEKKASALTRTILGVVEACHAHNVMHRDLKPENFLLATRAENAELKATDFGFSCFFTPGEVHTQVLGSPFYVAPEVLRQRYGQEADVWSAGVMTYILLCGVPPFYAETEQGIFEAVLRGEIDFQSPPWPNISRQAKDLISRMLETNPKKRITAPEALRHPWIAQDGVAPDKPLDSAVQSRLKQFTTMNKMKKLAIRIIAETMQAEEIEGLKKQFEMIDTDGSGSITFEELKTGLRRIGSMMTDEEVKELMEAADADKNGTIDYQEFVAATMHRSKIEKEESLLSAFNAIDTDNSGFITIDELRDACKKYGIDDDHIADTMREVDTNHDGNIDYSEFVAMMTAGNDGLGRKEKKVVGPATTSAGSAFANLFARFS